MTIASFEKRLKEIDPRFKIRKRIKNDLAAIYLENKYMVRFSLGEFNLNGYRMTFFDEHGGRPVSRIIKRGRKTTVAMLHKMFPLTLKQKASLLWGI